MRSFRSISYLQQFRPLRFSIKTDLIVASLALKAAARGGEAMVRANTMYLSDAQKAAALEEKAHVLAQSSDSLSQDIYHAISTS